MTVNVRLTGYVLHGKAVNDESRGTGWPRLWVKCPKTRHLQTTLNWYSCDYRWPFWSSYRRCVSTHGHTSTLSTDWSTYRYNPKEFAFVFRLMTCITSFALCPAVDLIPMSFYAKKLMGRLWCCFARIISCKPCPWSSDLRSKYVQRSTHSRRNAVKVYWHFKEMLKTWITVDPLMLAIGLI